TDRVLKRYRGLASGIAAQEHYAIRTPIGPVPHPRLSDVHGVHPQGKAASSDARVLERRDDSTLFEVDIHTGRAEQNRIHLAACRPVASPTRSSARTRSSSGAATRAADRRRTAPGSLPSKSLVRRGDRTVSAAGRAGSGNPD